MTTRTVVDCRWVGFSGIGRVTELFLEGLAEIRPPGEWVLWGPDAVRRYGFGTVVREDARPTSALGQRAWWRVPPGDRVFYPHLVRPLRYSRRAIVLAHDTIPVRFAEPRWKRPLQRLFYAFSARTARRVLVYSEATSENVQRDLGVAPERLTRIGLTVDLDLAARARRRRALGQPPYLLYVGLDRPQKNLDRALHAFAASKLSVGGGGFVLVGVQGERVDDVARRARVADALRVDVRPRCSDAELVELYAGASAVIVPSLEEGFGLPVVEALAAGVPVCCSATSSLPEAAGGLAELFDPSDVASMAAAIDRAVALGATGEWASRARQFDRAAKLPTPAEFAASIVAAMNGAERR